MNTHEDLGWRVFVIVRDGGCVAPRLDPDAGPCYGKWGDPADASEIEAHYVRRGSHGRRHQLAVDHVALCPGHHQGAGPQAGRIWATSHAEQLRRYLEGAA